MNDTPDFKMPPLALLAGGLATRMRPATETIPKAMLTVAGMPFIAHQLLLFASQGITDVVLLVGYLGEQVEAYVGDGSRFGLRVKYAYDGPILLGTGGALRAALSMLQPECLICYGDSYLDIDYRAVVADFRASGQPALMTIFQNNGQYDTSNVLFTDGQIRLYSKTERSPAMQHIDYGLAVIDTLILQQKPAGQAFDLALVYEELSRAGRLAGHQVLKRFYEIGSPSGLAETDAYVSARSSRSSAPLYL